MIAPSSVRKRQNPAGNRIRGKGGAAELLHLKPTTLEARMKKLRIHFRPDVQALG